MARRRMLSLSIINSARFIKMPPSTQCLYFHLNLRADDDGVVEAFSTMRLTGATEDDIKILDAKGFVKVLNEDLVTYITDWPEHNLIRADRKVDSIYKDLLLQILPEVKLVESRERADKKKGATSGRPADSVGKGSIVKYSTVKNRTEENNTHPRIKEFISSWKTQFPEKKFNEIDFNNRISSHDYLQHFDGLTEDEISQAVKNFSLCVNSPDHSFIKYKQPHAFLKSMIDYVDDAEPVKSKRDFKKLDKPKTDLSVYED